MTEQRLIDANHIVEVAEHAYGEWNLAMAAADGQRQINQVYKMKELCKAVKAVADAAPTVDAVEVVRCKKCAHCTVTSDGLVCERALPTKRMEDYYIYGSTVLARVAPDDFCSRGERRTDHV